MFCKFDKKQIFTVTNYLQNSYYKMKSKYIEENTAENCSINQYQYHNRENLSIDHIKEKREDLLL